MSAGRTACGVGGLRQGHQGASGELGVFFPDLVNDVLGVFSLLKFIKQFICDVNAFLRYTQ